MKTILKREWPLLLVLAAPFLFLAVVWPQIPDRVPSHFNLAFTPDGWMNKAAGLLLAPCVNVVMTMFVRFWFRHDAKLAKLDASARANVEKVFGQAMMTTALLLSGLSVALVWAAWGNFTPVSHVINYGILLLYFVLGNGMGKLSPNYTIGIRVPWTLESPAVWHRTHRFGGRLMVASCLMLLAALLLGTPLPIYACAVFATLVACGLITIVFAFVISRKPPGDPTNLTSA